MARTWGSSSTTKMRAAFGARATAPTALARGCDAGFCGSRFGRCNAKLSPSQHVCRIWNRRRNQTPGAASNCCSVKSDSSIPHPAQHPIEMSCLTPLKHVRYRSKRYQWRNRRKANSIEGSQDRSIDSTPQGDWRSSYANQTRENQKQMLPTGGCAQRGSKRQVVGRSPVFT